MFFFFVCFDQCGQETNLNGPTHKLTYKWMRGSDGYARFYYLCRSPTVADFFKAVHKEEVVDLNLVYN